jgi:aldose 1-epimerase
MAGNGQSHLIQDSSTRTISAGDLKALFLPRYGMLCASLHFRGMELLRRLEDMDSAAEKGSTAGMPLLYPWANRLESLTYRAAGKTVNLPATSALLHFDDHGLAIHGVPWALLGWDVVETKGDTLLARLEWRDKERLAIFPFTHSVEMRATIRPDNLLIETDVIAGDEPVPVSFGFHPYFGLPNIPRAEWHLQLPSMKRLQLNACGIPTGADEAFAGFDRVLGESVFDDGFAVHDRNASFSISGGGLRIALEFVRGYGYAQIFAPTGKDFIALEPMTAPTNALSTGHRLAIVEPGNKYQAAFRIRVDSVS